MKKCMKSIFTLSLALCFLCSFVISADAVDWVGTDAFGLFETFDEGDLIEYDYVSKTQRVIPAEEIFNYAATTTTTYELPSMASELARLSEMEAPQAQPTSIISPLDFTLSPPFNYGRYQPRSSGTMLLLLGIDEDGDGTTDRFERGTGFMVSPNVMVTAGHCIIWSNANETVVEVRVYPFYHGSPRPDKIDEDFIYPLTWVTSTEYPESIEYDWCIMTLQESIPNAFNFACSYNQNLNNAYVNINGYPMLNNNEDDCYQRNSAGYVQSVSDRMIFYNNNTLGGSSGSAVYLPNHSSVCVAIHTRGVGNGVYYNSGVRITQDLYNYICNRIENS